MAIDTEAAPPPAGHALRRRLRLVPPAGFDEDRQPATPPPTAPVDVLAELERLLATELDGATSAIRNSSGPRTSPGPRILSRPRFGQQGVLALLALMGLLTSFVGHGTLAYFSSSVVGAANPFSGGVIDIAGSYSGSTASVLPNASFAWTVNGASDGFAADGTTTLPSGAQAVCRNLLSGADTGRDQRMVPGQFCVAPIDVNNDNPTAVDAWMRMRLYRQTTNPSGLTGAAETARLANEALNDRLRFFMHEYTGSTTDNNKTARNLDCTTYYYRPDATTSAGKIASDTAGTTVATRVGSGPAGIIRTSLTSVGDAGKNVGTHPGTSYLSGAAVPAVTALASSGFKLTNGGGAAPSESNMATATIYTYTGAYGPGATAFNLAGNDEVTNPVKGGPTTNGTQAQGTNAEAQLAAGARRYYCAAIFFPSDTDITYAGASGDNAAFSGSLTYYLVVTAGQKAGRTTP